MNLAKRGCKMKRTALILTVIATASPALAQNAPNAADSLRRQLGAAEQSAEAVARRADLARYVQELQQNSSDDRLREQIISAAMALNPRPAIPEEARRHFVKGTTIQRDATNEGEAELAAAEYRAALLLAPWWGDAYYNLGLAAQMANRFDESISAFRLYLLTQPPAEDARDAQDRIYAVEAKRELSLRVERDRRDEEARAARQRAEANREALQRLVGQWRTMLPLGSGRHILDNCQYYNLETRSDEIIATVIPTPYTDPRNCGPQGPARPILRITVVGDRISAEILPPFMNSGTVMTGTLNFNEFKVYGPDNMRWELYRQGTYPVYRPGDCTAALC